MVAYKPRHGRHTLNRASLWSYCAVVPLGNVQGGGRNMVDRMHKSFKILAENLDPRFRQLMRMPSARYGSLPKNVPDTGIYLLSEGNRHLYVGRSNRIRQRLGKHSQPSSPPNAAAFAFQLAREKTGKVKATYKKKGSRKDLMKNRKFREAFSNAKERIRNMDVRYVGESDPTTQCLLEVYAAVVLKTSYNSFDTH